MAAICFGQLSQKLAQLRLSSARTAAQADKRGTVTLWFWACVCNLRQFCAANLINSLLSHLAAVANFSGLCCLRCLCCLSPCALRGQTAMHTTSSQAESVEGGVWGMSCVLECVWDSCCTFSIVWRVVIMFAAFTIQITLQFHWKESGRHWSAKRNHWAFL